MRPVKLPAIESCYTDLHSIAQKVDDVRSTVEFTVLTGGVVLNYDDEKQVPVYCISMILWRFFIWQESASDVLCHITSSST